MRRRPLPLILGLLLAALWSAAPSGVQARPFAAPARLPRALLVIKRFGAALRANPSSDAAILIEASCGAALRTIDSANGWYEVAYTAPAGLGGGRFVGWVGGARVADAASPPAYDCRNAVTFQIGQHVYSFVRSGCLSLRRTPSRRAVYDHCVANYHDYTVRNGPIAIAGEDWFGLSSPSTGGGWSLAQYLYPYR